MVDSLNHSGLRYAHACDSFGSSGFLVVLVFFVVLVFLVVLTRI